MALRERCDREKLIASLAVQLVGTRLVDYTPKQKDAHVQLSNMIVNNSFELDNCTSTKEHVTICHCRGRGCNFWEEQTELLVKTLGELLQATYIGTTEKAKDLSESPTTPTQDKAEETLNRVLSTPGQFWEK